MKIIACFIAITPTVFVPSLLLFVVAVILRATLLWAGTYILIFLLIYRSLKHGKTTL